jgi:CRP-like cAMP-binding protein
MPAPAREKLLQLGNLVQYRGRGKVLIREGDSSRFVLVILDGIVKIAGNVNGGRDALLSIRMAGDLVGEFAALDERPRSATVTTCGAVTARIIRAGEFTDSLRRDPDLSGAVSKSVVAKIRSANARRIDFSGCSVQGRLLRVLYDIAVTYGTRAGNQALIEWPLTQPELASLAGSAEPTVQRVLRNLRQEGVVSTGYRSINVLDLESLYRRAYP